MVIKAIIADFREDGSRKQITTARWLSPLQVASMLDLGKSTVYRMIEDGRLPAVRHGKTYRIAVEDLLQYIQKAKEW